MVVPSASKMTTGLFGKVPHEEEFAVTHSEFLGGEAQGINIISFHLQGGNPRLHCKKAAKCFSLKPPPWTSVSPSFLMV